MTNTPLQAAKPAIQKRSQETRDKLITALENLLAHHRFASITVQMLAAAAGVSVGTVYRRFDKKEALAVLVLELYQQRAREWSTLPDNRLEITADMSLRTALAQAVRLIWRQLEAMPVLSRALLDIARDRPDLVGTEMAHMQAQGVAGIEALLQHYKADIARDIEDARTMLFYFLQTILNDHALYRGDLGHFTPPADIDFCAHIADFAYGYLTTAEDA